MRRVRRRRLDHRTGQSSVLLYRMYTRTETYDKSIYYLHIIMYIYIIVWLHVYNKSIRTVHIIPEPYDDHLAAGPRVYIYCIRCILWYTAAVSIWIHLLYECTLPPQVGRFSYISYERSQCVVSKTHVLYYTKTEKLFAKRRWYNHTTVNETVL